MAASSSEETPTPVVTSGSLNFGASQVANAARNPELMQSMVETALNTVTAEDINRQRQNINSTQGKKVLAALKKQGIKPASIRKQILNSKNAQTQAVHKMMQEAPLVIVIRSNKVLSKHMVQGEEEEHIRRHTGTDVVMSPCTRLSSEDNTIFMCSQTVGKTNKRASKLVGYKVCGEVVFARKEGDLTVEAFAELERLHATTEI